MGQADGTREPLTSSRAARQARSIDAALERRTIPGDVRAKVSEALILAMRPRYAMDDHHPAHLHPGRSALILLHDVADLPHEAIGMATLHESEDAELRTEPSDAARIFDPALIERLSELPLPGDDALAERLVLLTRPQLLAVLAERLDHLRHLHLRPDLEDRWADAHAEVRDVWLPVTQRADTRLTRRFTHWERTFAKRLRRRERPS